MTANCDTVTNRVNPQEVFLALLKAKTYVGTAVFQVTTPGSSSTGGSGCLQHRIHRQGNQRGDVGSV